ncbi:Uncharacterised protein [Escherichia coli]|uniref:Uncharacterized protein n=1 Tax=Escherichia coli TaxID=562 RepID=A0A376Y7A9_ECOLX|nr:Uncharacterised protein [Escherichia coli]
MEKRTPHTRLSQVKKLVMPGKFVQHVVPC